MYENQYKMEYLYEAMDNVGDMFECLRDYNPIIDVKDFITQYMNSVLAQQIDSGNPRFVCMGPKELYLEALRKGVTIKEGNHFGGFMPNWIGRIYVLFGYTYNVKSKDMIKIIPLDYLARVYPGLQDLVFELAIQKIYNHVKEDLYFKE